MSDIYDGEYELPEKGLSNQNKGIHGNKKWALWSDLDSSPPKDARVHLWIQSVKDPKGDDNKGNDRLVVTPGGNVGIGISNPSAKLQVSGDLVLEKIASPPGPLSDGAARIFSDDRGVLHIQCPSGKSGSGTLQVTGNLSVDGNVSADKGLSVKNGLLEAKGGMTAEGALSAEAVKVSGGDLEAQKGLRVSKGLLEAKAGMTAEGALSAGVVKVSGGDLEAAKGLKVSKGLLEAKGGMTAEGALSAEAVNVSGGDLEATKGLKVSKGLLEAKGGMTAEGALSAEAVKVSGGDLEATKGLKVSKGLLEAKGGMTAEGALSAEAVKVSGGDLEAAKGLKVSKGLLEAKSGMTAEGALSAEAVKVSGGDLEAAKGLKVSKGLLEAKSGMTAEGALSAEAVKVSGGDLEALKGLKVSNGLLEAKAGMIIGGTLTVKEKIAVTVEGGTLNVGNGLNVGLDKFVVNSKGEATFDEKAEFKKGLNVTGILMKGGKIDVGAYYTLYGWYDDPDKTNKFQIAYEGKPAAWLHGNTGAWTQQSSRRFKENIAVISDALSKLDQVRGVYFDWIDGQPSVSSGSPKERQIGMIAEEVQAVFPELVSRNTHNNKEILGLAYSSFTAVLVQAVKELKAMNQSLSDRVKDLEASAMNES